MPDKHTRREFIGRITTATLGAALPTYSFAKEQFNVSYGVGANREVLEKQFSTVYGRLGSDLGKNLVVEQLSPKRFALVYRRQGSKKSSLTAAKNHQRLLRGTGIDTWILKESNNPVVYSERDYLGAGAVRNRTQTPNLEQEIETYIRGLRRRKKINSYEFERTGWSVYDYATGEKLVSINEDKQMQTASMFKPFVALAFFHQAAQGRFAYGPKRTRLMELMIGKSRNSATNTIIKLLGGPGAVQDILQESYPGIFQDTMIVEDIPPGGKAYRNKASPHDYSRFLFALWNDQLPRSDELKRLMSIPSRLKTDRLFTGARRIPNGTQVYNKTGTTKFLLGDMGILNPKKKDGGRAAYSLVGIFERDKNESYFWWKKTRANFIREVSNMVYMNMKQRHNLV